MGDLDIEKNNSMIMVAGWLFKYNLSNTVGSMVWQMNDEWMKKSKKINDVLKMNTCRNNK